MAEQRWSDIYVVFTKILCGRNFWVSGQKTPEINPPTKNPRTKTPQAKKPPDKNPPEQVL